MYQSQAFKRALVAANRVAVSLGSVDVLPDDLLRGVVLEMAENESGIFDVLGRDGDVIARELQRDVDLSDSVPDIQLPLAGTSASHVATAERWCVAFGFEAAIVEALLLVLLKAEVRGTEVLASHGISSRAVETYLVQLPRSARAFERPSEAGSFDFLVVWNPDVITPGEYAELIGALGDLARATGGLGIRRLDRESVCAFVAEGAHP